MKHSLSSLTMPHLALHKVSIFYTDSDPQSNGPTVLLLHGWSCDSHDWSFQIPALVSNNYRVIALDHRGHGRSSAPTDVSYKPEELADDAASLLDHLGITSTVVMGHSMGTVVASALSVRRPDLISKIILVDPVYYLPAAAVAPIVSAMGTQPHETAAMVFQRFYTPGAPAFLSTWHTRRLLGTPVHVVRDAFCGLYEDESCLGVSETSSEYLKQRQAPWMAVYAASDAASMDRGLCRSGVDEVHVLERGHFLHQEDSEVFNALMLKWLEKKHDAEVTR